MKSTIRAIFSKLSRRDSKKLHYLAIAGMLLLSTCSGPDSETGMGTFTIAFASNIRAAYPPNIPPGTNADPDAPTINDLTFVVTFTESPGSMTETFTFQGNQALHSSVTAGTYNVTMKVHLRSDNSLYAEGSAVSNPITIESGRDVAITMQMYPAGSAPADTGGNWTPTVIAGNGTAGYRDGPGLQAQFDEPRGIAIDAAGNLYVADSNNYRIRKVDPQGNVSTFAGSGNFGQVDGQGTSASFYFPYDAVVHAGILYEVDGIIKKIDLSTGMVTTITTTPTVSFPLSIAADAAGNLYITEFNDNRIKKINSSGVISILAGDMNAGYADGPGPSARFDYPHGLAVDSTGNVYVADNNNDLIRKIDPSGNVSTLAEVKYPYGLALDSTGNLYSTSLTGIRKIDPQGNLTTLVDSSQTDFPMGITTDSAGNLYVADVYSHQILKLSPGSGIPTPPSTGGGVVGTYVTNYTESGVTITFKLTLNSDSTYSITLSYIGYTEVMETGTYSVSGNTITFLTSDGETDYATISGNTIIWMTFVFTKQ